MEDVVLHYRPGSAAGLRVLVQRTEQLLEAFPQRAPPVFSPWFPSAADCHLPIRPARPAPVITCSGVLLDSERHVDAAQNRQQSSQVDSVVAERPGECAELTSRHSPQKPRDAVAETPNRLPPAPLCDRQNRQTHGPAVTDPPAKRSWSVFTQTGVLLRSPRSLSKPFHHVVSKHRLHLHQRAKWVISQHNCGGGRDIEQVWRALTRCVRGAGLPSCNANIQRERVEIWVFCDVLHAEQVGRHLKEALQLSGRIGLAVHRLGNVFSV